MRDDKTRTTGHDSAKVPQYLLLGVCIHRRQRVIQDKDPRSANQSPGNCSTLLLSAGKRDAAFAHKRLEFFGELTNIFCDSGFSCRALYLLPGREFDSKGDVPLPAIVENRMSGPRSQHEACLFRMA